MVQPLLDVANAERTDAAERSEAAFGHSICSGKRSHTNHRDPKQNSANSAPLREKKQPLTWRLALDMKRNDRWFLLEETCEQPYAKCLSLSSP